jgi:predicted MPP superfamily phosphohydrolase
VIDKFSWIHISDLHLKLSLSSWGQNVVLREMISDLASRAKGGVEPQFIIVSGDLASTGVRDEYEQVKEFLDNLRNVFSLSREHVFCVPGNHDVERSVQKTCWYGASQLLMSQQKVEEFLSDTNERETLLLRQSEFRAFERNYCSSSLRKLTTDGLGYVAPLTVEELPICVVGLNSAWLCQGGKDDEREIIVGDRQVIDAIELLKEFTPRLVIGVLHHPPDWLRRFDQAALENRLLNELDILHRGHLHDPDVKIVSILQGLSGHYCVVIGAGAAFARRHFENSYSIVTINLAESLCEVNSYIYVSGTGKWQAGEPQNAEIRLRGSLPGTLTELAAIISTIDPSYKVMVHYLAALLHGTIGEVPIPMAGSIVFALPTIMGEQPDPEVKTITKDFLNLRNILRAFPDNITLDQRVQEFQGRISSYANWLLRLAEDNRDFAIELSRREAQSQTLARITTIGQYPQTRILMKQLLEEQDWATLESVSLRHLGSTDPEIVVESNRMLALSLAHAEEPSRQEKAAEISSVLATGPSAKIDDALLGITLLRNLGRDAQAKELLLFALDRFPDDPQKLLEAGLALAIDTGDKELRKELRNALHTAQQKLRNTE